MEIAVITKYPNVREIYKEWDTLEHAERVITLMDPRSVLAREKVSHNNNDTYRTLPTEKAPENIKNIRRSRMQN